MKNLWMLLVLGLAVPAGAEIVSTISYNPARMGQYDYLKVSKDAVFKGGLSVPTDGALNVNSSGTVSMEWDAANADKIYNATTVTGGANTAVEMDQTTFRGGTALTSNAPAYSAANTTKPAVGSLEVSLQGGSLSATNNDSYVETLNGTNTYQHSTTNLNAATLNITGKNGDLSGLTTDGQTYKNAQTYGFHLAGVDIPHPTKHTVHKSGTTTKYQAELPSTCGLHWVKRTTADSKSVYVLAMDNCSASGGSITPDDLPDGDSVKCNWVDAVSYDGFHDPISCLTSNTVCNKFNEGLICSNNTTGVSLSVVQKCTCSSN